MVTVLLALALILAIITILALNNKAKKLNKEVDRQSSLGADIARKNICYESKINKLEEENKVLKEENLKANEVVRKQEGYVYDLEKENEELKAKLKDLEPVPCEKTKEVEPDTDPIVVEEKVVEAKIVEKPVKKTTRKTTKKATTKKK